MKSLSILVLLALSLSFVSCTEKSKDTAAPPVKQVVVQEAQLKPICKPGQNAATQIKKPIVIMVSIDGLRADYIQTHQPPNILKIIKQGIYTTDMIPSYPTLTFPNHYTLATGRYPGHHGIVSNSFYDAERKETYDAFKSDIANDSTWYGGEPIWNVVEKSGMLAHTIDWVGSSAHVGKMDPTCYTNYDANVTFSTKINKAFEYLNMPEETRPHFITLYTSEVDDAGHGTGPYSEQTKKALMNVDQELGRLWDHIQTLNLPINLIVVSDHGMEALDANKIIYLEDYISIKDQENYKFVTGAAGMIYSSDPLNVQLAYNALKAKEQNFKVYLKGETPAEYFMDNAARTGDIVIVPDIPYYITAKRDYKLTKMGNHGWDFTNSQMHAFFMAAGKNIASNKTVTPFKNIDVYPFVMGILGVSTKVPYDGSADTLKPYIVTK